MTRRFDDAVGDAMPRLKCAVEDNGKHRQDQQRQRPAVLQQALQEGHVRCGFVAGSVAHGEI